MQQQNETSHFQPICPIIARFKVSSLIDDHERQIAGRFRHVRYVNHLSQSAFGRALGISRNRVADVESARTPLRYRIAWTIRERWGISITWIENGKFPPYQPDLDPWPNPSSLKNPRVLLSSVAETIEYATPAARKEAERKWFETYKKDHSKFSMLTLASTSAKTEPVQNQWQRLKRRIKNVTDSPGGKSALAKSLGVDLTQLSKWLTDAKSAREPGADYTLKMLQWVQERESQQ